MSVSGDDARPSSDAEAEEADFVRAGHVVVLDGDPWEVLATSHHGEGTPGVFYPEWVVLDLRNLVSGGRKSLRLSLGSPVRIARLEEKTIQFLYATPGHLHFMDASTFEALDVAAAALPHLVSTLRAGDLVDAQAFGARPLPHTLRLRPRST